MDFLLRIASGACKVWLQFRREAFAAARCTVDRADAQDWAIRGKPVKKTAQNRAAACPFDPSTAGSTLHAAAPPDGVLRVLVSTGLAYVALVIDAYGCRIVGWRRAASRTACPRRAGLAPHGAWRRSHSGAEAKVRYYAMLEQSAFAA